MYNRGSLLILIHLLRLLLHFFNNMANYADNLRDCILGIKLTRSRSNIYDRQLDSGKCVCIINILN